MKLRTGCSLSRFRCLAPETAKHRGAEKAPRRRQPAQEKSPNPPFALPTIFGKIVTAQSAAAEVTSRCRRRSSAPNVPVESRSLRAAASRVSDYFTEGLSQPSRPCCAGAYLG